MPVQDRRTIAIGDIHGCALELQELLKRLKLTRDDRVVFLGDYVDRGPESRHVLDLVLETSSKCEVVALRGNHEEMFLDFLHSPESAPAALFVFNGGASTLAQYLSPEGDIPLPKEHLEFLTSLRMTFETDTHFFVHAGVPVGRKLSEISIEKDWMTLLWVRSPFLESTYRWEKIVVHGHTPCPKPEIRPNRINIDTACVYGGHLSAIDLTEGKIHSVEMRPRKAPALQPRDPSGLRESVRFHGRVPVELTVGGADVPLVCETLNYHQFGLLVQSGSSSGDHQMQVGKPVSGTIGLRREGNLRFEGEIVRVDRSTGKPLYGIRIDRLATSLDTQWVERPKVA